MNKLIIDTSTYYLYVSVIKNDENYYNKVLYGKNTHSENLMNVITEGLQDMEMKELNEIIVGIGPGSYTGVRIALTVAKTLAWTLNIPLKTISSLSLISSGYNDINGTYAVSCIAKKGHIYGKIFRIEDKKMEILLDDIFLQEEEFKSYASKYDAKYIAEGDYKFDDSVIDKLSIYSKNVHEVVPNYLRKANS